MAKRPTSSRTRRAMAQLGEFVSVWRRQQRLTQATVADRAGISLPTLRAVERGDPGVGLATFLEVVRAVGALDRVIEALDPYETDLGRVLADQRLPKRVRT